MHLNELSNEKKENSLNSQVIKFACGVLVVAVLYAGGIFALYAYSFPGEIVADHGVWGQFGDFFGGTLNPIFAILSLLAILGTLIIQSRELSHSTLALREQSEYLNLQAFENTFFSMIQLSNENVKTFDLEETESRDECFPGRGAFRFLLIRLSDSYDRTSRYNVDGLDERQVITEAYEVFYNSNHRFVGHYLGGLERMFEFIEKRRPLEKEQYYFIVKAQLSANELKLLFYNSLVAGGVMGIDNMNKYKMFDKLPTKLLLNESLHASLINPVGGY
ncbi:putative phage abortive infection protein [Pseudomonas viridiflava]|uniref:putative phage abortive infection protein n=1 Tax=Pseudomonas viridiflava TaxID=33069 RepID=UPI002EC0BF77|nr:putative phage abortive infection protein [Pseudomonas viridiflava]